MVVVVGMVLVVMEIRVYGRMVQISTWELQVVSISVVTMVSSTKALILGDPAVGNKAGAYICGRTSGQLPAHHRSG